MNMKRAMAGNYRNKQQGAVLAVSLIILLVVTILSVQGIQTTLMQDKMTSAVRDGHVALEAAEAGLIDAETFIETLVSTTDFKTDGAGGLYSVDTPDADKPVLPKDAFTDVLWGAAITREGTSIDEITPRYFVMELGTISANSDSVSLDTGYGHTGGGGDITGFKIVSRAFGKNANTERIVVSYYGKRL